MNERGLNMSKCLGCLPTRFSGLRKDLNWRWSSQDLTSTLDHLYEVLVFKAAALPTVPQCQPQVCNILKETEFSKFVHVNSY